MAASGLSTAEEFEIRFSKASGRIRLSSGLWSRYLRGEVIPQGAITKRARSLIERLDAEYLGTADIYRHPVWELLNFERLLGPEELKRIYLRLDKSIWKRFVVCGHDLLGSTAPELSMFWRFQRGEGGRTYWLKRIDGMDGLAACLIEARMGYLGQNEEVFFNSLKLGLEQCEKLRSLHAFASKRMQTILLLMEGICIGYLDRLVIQSPFSDDGHGDRRRASKNLLESWIKRHGKHKTTLSASSKAIFDRWTKETLVQKTPSSISTSRSRAGAILGV
jgi:hypothetical protein